MELTGRFGACWVHQLPAAGRGGLGDPGRLTGGRPKGRGTFTGRQLNADPLGGRYTTLPDPVETLRLLVEAGVAIAGFSGVVVVFGRRAERAWSPIERDRLENLLTTSLTAVFMALLALVLLHGETSSTLTWRISSGTWSIVASFSLWVAARRAMRADRQMPERPHVAWIVSILVITSLAICLNVANLLIIGEFWPFLAALVWLFAVSAYSFVRLLFVVGRGGSVA